MAICILQHEMPIQLHLQHWQTIFGQSKFMLLTRAM